MRPPGRLRAVRGERGARRLERLRTFSGLRRASAPANGMNVLLPRHHGRELRRETRRRSPCPRMPQQSSSGPRRGAPRRGTHSPARAPPPRPARARPPPASTVGHPLPLRIAPPALSELHLAARASPAARTAQRRRRLLHVLRPEPLRGERAALRTPRAATERPPRRSRASEAPRPARASASSLARTYCRRRQRRSSSGAPCLAATAFPQSLAIRLPRRPARDKNAPRRAGARSSARAAQRAAYLRGEQASALRRRRAAPSVDVAAR